MKASVNVIPDTTLGLVRREGFELLPWKEYDGTPIEPLTLTLTEPGLKFDFQNKVNEDYLYFGCVKKNGEVSVFNQDGERGLFVTPTKLFRSSTQELPVQQR